MRRSSDIRTAKFEFPKFLSALPKDQPVMPAIVEFCEDHAVEPDVIAPLITDDIKALLAVERETFVKPKQRVIPQSHKRRDLQEVEMAMFFRDASKLARRRAVRV